MSNPLAPLMPVADFEPDMLDIAAQEGNVVAAKDAQPFVPHDRATGAVTRTG